MVLPLIEKNRLIRDEMDGAVIVLGGKAYERLTARQVDWEGDRVSARDKRPPGPVAYFDYEVREAGGGWSETWDAGVLIRQLPLSVVDEKFLFAGTEEVYQADQFLCVRATSRPPGEPSFKIPMGQLVHSKMVWLFCFSKGGQEVRTRGLVNVEDPEENPFRVSGRVLSTYPDDRYFPIGCPWPPLATFGLLNAGSLTVSEGRNGWLTVEW